VHAKKKIGRWKQRSATKTKKPHAHLHFMTPKQTPKTTRTTTTTSATNAMPVGCRRTTTAPLRALLALLVALLLVATHTTHAQVNGQVAKPGTFCSVKDFTEAEKLSALPFCGATIKWPIAVDAGLALRLPQDKVGESCVLDF
jgi:hypothetical protein